MQKMDMCHDGWAEFVNDEEHGGCVIPMMIFPLRANHEDPEMALSRSAKRSARSVIVHKPVGLKIDLHRSPVA
jgi:hypothetical protein